MAVFDSVGWISKSVCAVHVCVYKRQCVTVSTGWFYVTFFPVFTPEIPKVTSVAEGKYILQVS